MKIHQTELQIVRGSVLEIPADAIVNAANTAMRGGGALDGAIHRAAGPEMMEELRRVAPNGAETAEVVVTPGFAMTQRFVFHVAGPIWKEFRADECESELDAAYWNCLCAAQERGLQSLAFPSLSTGVYAFPLERAAPIALCAAIQFLEQETKTSLRRVTFSLFGGEEFHVFRRALEKLETV